MAKLDRMTRKLFFRTARQLLGRRSNIERLSDTDYVRYCYEAILERTPDDKTVQEVLHAFTRGTGRIELIETLIESEEFRFKLSEFVQPGHFYSVMPSWEAIEAYKAGEFEEPALYGITLREEAQWALLQQLQQYYHDMPYHQGGGDPFRFRYDNGAFAPSDAFILHGMMRHFRPKRIIEIGSGWSSGVILDTAEHFLDAQTEITFIEPYPELLYNVMKPQDDARVRVLPHKVQDVDLDEFKALEANDILFIDSSHVSKLGSDVNHLLFAVLPLLKQGVNIHIHDIFYPFSFPTEWLDAHMFWNEHYLLRAFLQYNNAFDILLFSSMMIEQHRDWVAEQMPDCLKVGGCLWLQKVVD